MKVFPAYGRRIAQLMARGVKPVAAGVLLSSRWWWFEAAPRMCIRPDEWARGRWEFGFLRGERVVAILGEDAELWQWSELLIELMSIGPRLILLRDLNEWIEKTGEPLLYREYATISLMKAAGEEQGTWKGFRFHDPAVVAADACYRRAYANAEAADSDAVQTVERRGGDYVRHHAALAFRRQQAHELFDDPYAVPDDARAA